LRLLFSLIVLLCCCSQAFADVVWLKNGDRISGEIITKKGEKMLLRTPYAGDIEVNWREVDRFSTARPLTFILRDDNRLVGMAVSKEDGGISIDAGAVLKTVPLLPADIVAIYPRDYRENSTKVHGRLNAGLTGKGGNTDTGAMHVDGELVVRTKENRYTVGAGYNWEQDNDSETESNLSLYSKYDHFVNQKWYLSTKASFLRDRFRDLKLRSLLGAGLGYQIWESEERNLSLEAGVDYVNEDFFSAPDDEYPGGRWALQYDQFLFGRITQAFHRHEVSIGLKDIKDFLFTSETGLRFPLANNFNASLQYDYDWDNTPAPGRKRSDNAYMFNLGYSW